MMHMDVHLYFKGVCNWKKERETWREKEKVNLRGESMVEPAKLPSLSMLHPCCFLPPPPDLSEHFLLGVQEMFRLLLP